MAIACCLREVLNGKIDMRSRSMEDVPIRLEMNAELVEMASVRKL